MSCLYGIAQFREFFRTSFRECILFHISYSFIFPHWNPQGQEVKVHFAAFSPDEDPSAGHEA